MTKNSDYVYTGSGTNSQDNHYCTRNNDGVHSYHYSNKDGSYYYANADKSTYYNDGKGDATYTAPNGDTYKPTSK